MSDVIYIRSGELGNRTEMPKLRYDESKGSEMGFNKTEEALYIATANGNARLCGVKDIGNINTLLEALNGRVDEITARLEALEKPSE